MIIPASLNVLVNGSSHPFRLRPNWTFHDLIDFLRKSYTTQAQLISSFQVDGVELTPELEKSLQSLPLTHLDKIEIKTVNRSSLINETLTFLMEFIQHTSKLAFDMSGRGTETIEDVKLLQLVDGLDTIFDTIKAVKTAVSKTLSPDSTEKLLEMESELLEILKGVLTHREKNNPAELGQLIGQKLPPHLDLWRAKGIPLLLRSIDQ